MAKYERLVKLHIEIDRQSISRRLVKLLYGKLKLHLVASINRYRRLSKREYPVSYRDLMRLVRVYYTPTVVYIGIVPDYLKGNDKELFRKILDVEYCVSGIEQRVLRRALEDCFIDL